MISSSSSSFLLLVLITAAAAAQDTLTSPLLEEQQRRAAAAALAQTETQLLQFTDLICLLLGLGGLAMVLSSAFVRECRRVPSYLLCMIAFVLVGAFWCVAQVGARQTGVWTTCVVAIGWIFLLRWGTFWVPPGHQIVLKVRAKRVQDGSKA